MCKTNNTHLSARVRFWIQKFFQHLQNNIIESANYWNNYQNLIIAWVALVRVLNENTRSQPRTVNNATTTDKSRELQIYHSWVLNRNLYSHIRFEIMRFWLFNYVFILNYFIFGINMPKLFDRMCVGMFSMLYENKWKAHSVRNFGWTRSCRKSRKNLRKATIKMWPSDA